MCFGATHIALAAEVVSFATDVSSDLTLHRVVRGAGVSGHLEADVFLLFDIIRLDRSFMCRPEEKSDISKRSDSGQETHTQSCL